jgi:ankyrin repeat protein
VLVNAKAAIGYFIKVGAGVEARDESLWTPLHWAVNLGYKETAIALINAGASIKARDKNGVSPYYIAAGKSQEWANELCRYYEHIKAISRRAHIQLDEFKQQLMQQQKMLADMQAQIQQLSAQVEQLKQAQASPSHQQPHLQEIESPSASFFSSTNSP